MAAQIELALYLRTCIQYEAKYEHWTAYNYPY